MIPFRFNQAYLQSAICRNGAQYIFNGRPANQPPITQERLNLWYRNLFKEAKERAIIKDVTYKFLGYDSSSEMNHSVSIHFSYSPYISYYKA